MRIFNVDGDSAAHDADELVSFTARTSVRAVECPEGASLVTADGETVAATDRPCYVVVDGDDYELVPAVVFDTLYRESDSDSDTQAAPAETTRQDVPSNAGPGLDVPLSGGTTSGGVFGDSTVVPQTPGGAAETALTATDSVAGLADTNTTDAAQQTNTQGDNNPNPAPGQ